jgi:hypothetical protein
MSHPLFGLAEAGADLVLAEIDREYGRIDR